jgi:hypothetical protein
MRWIYQWRECIANGVNTIAPKLRENSENNILNT